MQPSGSAGSPAPLVADLTAKEVGLLLGDITERTVQRYAREGKIKYQRRGRLMFFKREWVDEYLARNTFGPDAAEGGAK